MRRYIDANLAKAQFTGNFQDSYSPEEAKAMIDEVPTADVVPVVHGHWIVTDNGVNGKTADCSVCGAHFVYFKGHLQMDKMPGCPKCLSKMDEEVKHNEQ